jgi:hypothetical protein
MTYAKFDWDAYIERRRAQIAQADSGKAYQEFALWFMETTVAFCRSADERKALEKRQQLTRAQQHEAGWKEGRKALQQQNRAACRQKRNK